MQLVLRYFFYQTRKTLFLVGAGLLFALTLSSFIDEHMVDALKQNISVPLQILYAELIGFVSPGPRYILYPLLATLHDYGIGTGVIVALISGHVLIEPSTFFVEIGFFGYRFPLKRFFISLVVTFLAGLLTTFLID
ncbi:MAG: hypothetical protein H6696_04015 [Deferribacteres bacterium]|nr:hypothetical protein [candidate division KSB1 bacterium]MCB9501079.1 hypothetical protein [Deferribacteres bacterium]